MPRYSGEPQHNLHTQQPRDTQVRDRQVGYSQQRFQPHSHRIQAQE